MIGLDGLDPSLVNPLLASGDLPNLAKLRSLGGFSRVATTTPAQTPVAWSSFATGANPGRHGIFDFLRRDPKTYQIDLGLNCYDQRNPFVPPKPVNRRRGVPVWDLLGSAGVPSTILRCPCTYPPAPIQGRLLAGMGVPDLRGGLGTSTFYTTDPSVRVRESENVVLIKRTEGQSILTHLIGPRNPKDRTNIQLGLRIGLDPETPSVSVSCAGGTGEVPVVEGQWSDWLKVKFKLGMLNSVCGMVRFHLVRLEPEIELYASPINFDPSEPAFPISAPESYAGQLAQSIGIFHTTGMVEDHTGLSNGRISLNAFLDQCDEVWDEREAMMLYELERFEAGLFFCLFDTPDRVQHMLWRHREPGHPALLGEPADPEIAQLILDHYKRGDQAVGEALKFVDHETLLVVLSDHGFNSFRRGVHLNTWLHDQGLLTLKHGHELGHDAGELFRSVDWGRTKAYALGLGGIYLNLKGREGDGIVEPAESETLARSIVNGLTGLVDEGKGSVAIRSVKTRDQLYSGPFAAESPDLFVNFAAGYRVSWSSSMGGLPPGHFEDNTKAWSGDHIIDPLLVPGCLFMNQPFAGENANLVDLAPTILAALGLPNGADMEGSSLIS